MCVFTQINWDKLDSFNIEFGFRQKMIDKDARVFAIKRDCREKSQEQQRFLISNLFFFYETNSYK